MFTRHGLIRSTGLNSKVLMRDMLHLRTLQKITSVMKGEAALQRDAGGTCCDTEDFYDLTDELELFADVRWDAAETAREPVEAVLAEGRTEELSSDRMIVRFLDKMMIFEEGVEVTFRGGLCVWISDWRGERGPRLL